MYKLINTPSLPPFWGGVRSVVSEKKINTDLMKYNINSITNSITKEINMINFIN